jgi:hypothetical protein
MITVHFTQTKQPAECKKQRKEKEGKGSNISTSLTTIFKLGAAERKGGRESQEATKHPPPLPLHYNHPRPTKPPRRGRTQQLPLMDCAAA